MAKSFIKSVSITEEMYNFLEEHPEISLSTIIQSKLLSIMEFQRPSDAAILELRRKSVKAINFINEKGLLEEFNAKP